MISFPGYVDANGSPIRFFEWYDGRLYNSLVLGVTTNYSVLALLSTCVTIYSICKIFQTTSRLSATNPNIKINKSTMILHCCLLVIQTAESLATTIPYDFSARAYLIIYTALPIVDLIVQVMICYICWTVGA